MPHAVRDGGMGGRASIIDVSESALSTSSLWYDGQGGAALRKQDLPDLEDGYLRVRSLFGGLSRGTERLVFTGRVPDTEYARMRCPFQAGEFPGPVRYGYQTVGEIVGGPPDRLGELVFALHPHQTMFDVPQDAAVPVPDGIPPQRAVLSANAETALNVIWDSGVSAGDRVLVVGAGVVGSLAAWIAGRMPGTSVVLCDVEEAAAPRATALGVTFSTPNDLHRYAPYDVGINTSGTAKGLQSAIDHAGMEARIVEASWYGAGDVPLALGGAFHSKRLSISSSQVGRVPPDRAPRWTLRRRLETAIELLDDPVLDVLLSDPVDFAELPVLLPRMFEVSGGPPCPLIRYPET
ncbi:MAG: zinc-binding alcohol dehydrogenase [Pseudomonadota bacterium]